VKTFKLKAYLIPGGVRFWVAVRESLRKTLERLRKRWLDNRWGHTFERTMLKLGRDSASDTAASLSYYTLLSVFPLLIGVIAILGFVFPHQAVQAELFKFFETNLPTSAGLLQDNITSIMAWRGTLGILSLLGLFWSGSALFASIGRIANRAWGVHTYRPFLVRKLRDLILSVGTGIIFFISLGLAALQAFLPGITLPFNITLTEVVTQSVVLLLIYAAFLLINRYGPNANVRWKDVWLGALISALMFETARNLFTLYLERFANFQRVYGSVASVIAFLAWVYLSSFILIIGIEISAQSRELKPAGKPAGKPAAEN
jgi:membrane protein